MAGFLSDFFITRLEGSRGRRDGRVAGLLICCVSTSRCLYEYSDTTRLGAALELMSQHAGTFLERSRAIRQREGNSEPKSYIERVSSHTVRPATDDTGGKRVAEEEINSTNVPNIVHRERVG